MLLTEHRNTHTIHQDVVAIAVSREYAEQGMSRIAAFEFDKHGVGLAAEFRPLVPSLAAHAPGIVEIRPVDIGYQFTNLIYNMVYLAVHQSLNLTASPR